MKVTLLKTIYGLLALVVLSAVLLYIFEPAKLNVAFGMTVTTSVLCLLISINSINKKPKDEQ